MHHGIGLPRIALSGCEGLGKRPVYSVKPDEARSAPTKPTYLELKNYEAEIGLDLCSMKHQIFNNLLTSSLALFNKYRLSKLATEIGYIDIT